MRFGLQSNRDERRHSEKRWLKTGWMDHKQIYISANKMVTKLVHKAKTRGNRIRESLSCKELFRVTNRLL